MCPGKQGSVMILTQPPLADQEMGCSLSEDDLGPHHLHPTASFALPNFCRSA
jgi:hypothetical protein